MSNSNNQIKGNKNKKDFLTSKRTTICLFLIIFGAAFNIDHYLAKNLLSFPLIISTLCSFIGTYFAIPKLQSLKLKQIIRIEGPKKHQSKAGTPTMGGFFIITIGLIIGNIININNKSSNQLLLVSLLILTYMLIGLLDDWRSLRLHSNTGLKPKEKITLQSIAGILFFPINTISFKDGE